MFASCQKARNDDTCSECLTQIGLEIHLKQLHVGIKFLFFHLKLINEETFFGNKRWKICTGKHFRNTMRLHSISLNFFLQYFQVGKIFFCSWLYSKLKLWKMSCDPKNWLFFDFPNFFPVEFFHLMKGRLRMQSFKIMGHKTWLRRLPIAFMILQ